MSPRTRSAPNPGPEEAAEAASTPPGTVIELLTDDHAREILSALRAGPKAARELIEECEGSKPTVYRRLDRLESADLVDSRTAIHPDGHHRKEFATEVERVTVEFDDGDCSAAVARGDGPGAARTH